MKRLLLSLVFLIACSLPGLAAAQTGGPNAFGYVYEPATYDLVPVPSSEPALAVMFDGVAIVSLPWTFSWYGVDYSTVNVGENGGIAFVSTWIDWPTCFPAPSGAPDIAVFWDDFDTSYAGTVHAWHDTTSTDRFVVAWEAVETAYWMGDTGTVQIHLYPDGDVELHWSDTFFGGTPHDNAANATIGIQDPAATDPLEFSCATTQTLDGTAMLFTTDVCEDIDGDGFDDLACGGDDCDDADPAINPDAAEVCGDTIDQDCDGVDPLGDEDGDGYLNAACGGDDCDDYDPALNPGVDADGDGWDACLDCSELFDFINPGQPEICGDAIDQDCSGVDEQPDGDFDGYTNAACGGDDCDDTDASIYPGIDSDGDGFDVCEDCDDESIDVNPSQAEVCDGADTDCSGVIDDLDEDGDGDYRPECGGTDCDDNDPAVGAGTDADADGYDACIDCDDANPAAYPDAPEACDDIDTDCDGLLDGEDVDVGGVGAAPIQVTQTGIPLPFCLVGQVDFEVTGATVDVFDVDLTIDVLVDPTSDLTVTLESPSGTVVTLADGVGDPFVSPNFTDTVFDDSATTSINDGVAPYTGSFTPEEPLSAFYGEDPNGTWMLLFTPIACTAWGGTINEAVLDLSLASPDDADGDGWNACGDCDEADPTVNPGAPEICLDGLDQDCDGLDATGDLDTDGYIDADCGGDDCDDTDPAIHPGVDADGDGSNMCDDCDDADPDNAPGNPEYCGDGFDQNCDGEDDVADFDNDGYTNIECIGGDDCDDANFLLHPGIDADGDGFSVCDDCNDSSSLQYPGNPEVCGDFMDNNCDGLVDDVDEDGDGYYSPECAGDDCDDTDPEVNPGVDGDGDGVGVCADSNDVMDTIYPGAPENCGDGLDQDCDGVDLEADVDGDGVESEACGGSDCDDTNPEINPTVDEACDGFDWDCDGDTWEVDEDGDGHFDAECGGEDCDDQSQGVHPLAPEICNGVDDNCDGELFEGGEDDADEDGVPACDGDCDDNDSTVYPGADELCNDRDDNCDGIVDEGIVPDADSDGHLKEECGGDDCEDLSASINPDATEDCVDGYDNDCNGLVDGDDEACDFSSGGCDDCEGSLAPGQRPAGLALLTLLVGLAGLRRRRG